MKKASFLALTLCVVALIGCGGDDSDENTDSVDVHTYCPEGDQTSGQAGQVLEVTDDRSGAPRFKPTQLTANAGQITILLRNPSDRCHDIAVKDPAGEVYGNTERFKRGTGSVVLDLQPGEYFYYSTIPGESDAGMIGTLRVE